MREGRQSTPVIFFMLAAVKMGKLHLIKILGIDIATIQTILQNDSPNDFSYHS